MSSAYISCRRSYNPPRLLFASPPFNPPLFLQFDQTTYAKVDALVVMKLLLIGLYVSLRGPGGAGMDRGVWVTRPRRTSSLMGAPEHYSCDTFELM